MDLVGIVGHRVVDAGLASALLAGLASLAMVATRQPARRRALARAAILATLLAIPLVCLRPFRPIDLIGPIREALGPALEWVAGPGLLARLDDRAWTRRASGLLRALPGPLLIGYLASVAFGLGRVALGSLGTAWLARRAAPPSESAAASYAAIPSPAGRARPRLRVSGRLGRPVLVGAFRPTILIPTDLDRPESAGALRLALLHELAHAGASDPTFGLASELASAFWFWLPPLSWIRRQMRLDQEYLADRAASSLLGASSRYASTLVEIAARPRPPGRGPLDAGPSSSGGSSLYRRIMMLVRCPFPVEDAPPRSWRGGLAVLTVVALLTATGLTLQATPAPPGGGPPIESRLISIPKIILQGADGADGLANLPVRLPESFDLSFEVYASTADLGRIRVLGRPLADQPLAQEPSADGPRWHRVRLDRRDKAVGLTVDEAPIPRQGPSTDEWLTIQCAAGVATPFRLLRLAW